MQRNDECSNDEAKYYKISFGGVKCEVIGVLALLMFKRESFGKKNYLGMVEFE